MEETISLQEIFNLLKKKAALIISMFFVGVGISALVTFILITPKYSAGAQLIASSKNTETNNISTDNINSNLMMINTYKDFVKGRIVTEAATEQLADEIGFVGTADDLKNMLNVEQTQNSQMFTITVTSENPTEAATAVNIVANIFEKEAQEYTSADKVSIISNAEVPENPVSPNKKVNLAIGGVLGLIIGVGLALLSQLFNRTVKTVEYVTDTFGIPVLGNIPLSEAKDVKEIKRNQGKALESANSMTNQSDSIYSFDDGEDGLEKDISRINDQENLEDTIDLSALKINQIDLSEMETDNKQEDDSRVTRRRSR